MKIMFNNIVSLLILFFLFFIAVQIGHELYNFFGIRIDDKFSHDFYNLWDIPLGIGILMFLYWLFKY